LNMPISFGGTTLLIMVVVMLDIIAQVGALLVPTKYRNMTHGSNIAMLNRRG